MIEWFRKYLSCLHGIVAIKKGPCYLLAAISISILPFIEVAFAVRCLYGGSVCPADAFCIIIFERASPHWSAKKLHHMKTSNCDKVARIKLVMLRLLRYFNSWILTCSMYVGTNLRKSYNFQAVIYLREKKHCWILLITQWKYISLPW